MKEPILYRILRPLGTILFKVFFHPHIIGQENIQKEGGLILAGNHTSYFDCALLYASTKRTIHFLAKYELTKGPLAFFFNNFGIIPVNRQAQNNKAATNTAITYLKNKKLIGIFPEGTINRTDDVIMPFKMGAIKMAKESNASIVPFAITGTYKIFGKSVTIKYGKPYKVKSHDLEQERRILEEKISKMILEGR